jgi:DNA invertase Pin-like site-specific DNA recombinase
MKKAVIYVRTASIGKDTKLRINKQIKTCESFLGEDYRVIETVTDIGVSGIDFDRLGFKKLLRLAKSKQIDVVVAEDRARFTRNFVDDSKLNKLFNKYGVELRSARGKL